MSATLELPEKARELFVRDEIPEDLGWITWLTPSHLRLFSGEVYAATQAGASNEEMAELLDSWKATAELDHSPELLEQLERNRGRNFMTADEWQSTKNGTRS
jgi:hypothetical protein